MVTDNQSAEDRRFFEFDVDGEVRKFYLDIPTSEQIRKAEWHYSKMYNKALVEGVATSAEMIDILTRRGLYGPEYEKKLQELQVSIALKIAEMQNSTDDSKKESCAREVENLRNDLYRWNQRLSGPLNNCCEQMAEDAKTEYLTSVSVKDEKGNLVWKDYDSFIAESNQGLALKARVEVLLWLQGLESDFLDKTPEQVVLQEVALKRAEKAKEDRLEAEEIPQLEAPKEEHAEASPKKKRGRKASAK